MNAKVEEQGGRLDGLKWAVVVLLIAAGVFGNSYYGDFPVLYRALVLVAMAAVAAWMALMTASGQSFSALVKDARTEIRKVVWPTRPETMQTTMIVVGVVLLAGLVLWLLDSLLSYLVKLVIG